MKITLSHYQLKELLEMSESSCDPECYDAIVIQVGDDTAHSGPGLYAWFDECPEEGASYIGDDAEDQERANRIGEERENAKSAA
ncbi:hypothetical protein [Pseudomonas fluorescens]|uniref:Uncharacterized protein n=2 Tax=Pseudomonas fluorescens TaxID=294 RepID=A0ABY1TE96_PSEFL|nr:hypothetical protein [Pseudomonas fluorescens]MCI4605351.1 hypothetical protein [Pseudomonas fluorescens]PQB00186.1 hypothetical protein B0A76_14145 [Pseudomonas fluorescens]RFP96753.1 hypothetical protein D0N73_07595 [Pseudomonas fluorescens]RMO68209.1 hypothetical protein ALQ35_03898 [Pseudomonas fluorescens]TWR48647.1 hypothetical protein FIP59_07240 [Pseudomonas fluorescens]